MTHGQGAYGRLALLAGAAPYTWSGATAFEFLAENLTLNGRHVGGRGIRGRLARQGERRRNGGWMPGGQIVTYISPNYLEFVLDTLFGYTQSGQAHTLGDPTSTPTVLDFTLPQFGILIDRDVAAGGGIFEFKDCKVDYWMVEARAAQEGERGEPDAFRMTIGIKCEDFDDSINGSTSGTWPSGLVPGTATADEIYVLSDTDAAVTIEGATRPIQWLKMWQANFTKQKMVNSLKPHSIRPQDQQVGLQLQAPWYTSNQGLFRTMNPGSTTSATIVMTNGTMSATWAFGDLHAPDDGPVIKGKSEVEFFLNAESYATADTSPLVVTNDIT